MARFQAASACRCPAQLTYIRYRVAQEMLLKSGAGSNARGACSRHHVATPSYHINPFHVADTKLPRSRTHSPVHLTTIEQHRATMAQCNNHHPAWSPPRGNATTEPPYHSCLVAYTELPFSRDDINSPPNYHVAPSGYHVAGQAVTIHMVATTWQRHHRAFVPTTTWQHRPPSHSAPRR